MSQTKTPDADANTIQSLDEDQSNTGEIKAPLMHIYYEPEKLSDVQINYENTAFHLHMAIVARESVYFRNLFEEADMNKEPIQLPQMRDFCNETIDEESVKYFFDRIYQCESIVYKVGMINSPFFKLIYLCHYFQVERLEKNLKSIISQFVKLNSYLGENVFSLLFCCQSCKWIENEKELVQFILCRFDYLRTSTTNYAEYWPKLNSSVKQQIYSAVLNRNVPADEAEEWRKTAKEAATIVTDDGRIRDSIAEGVLLAALKLKKLLQ